MTAIVGLAGSRHGAPPWFSTTMSDPRLPAAPPHGPPVARMSAPTQAARAADGLGALLVGAAEPVAVGDGEAVGLGLGLGLLLQAPTRRTASTARIAMDVDRRRPACAIVGLIR